MPAASISNVVTGTLKDADLGAKERKVLAEVFRQVADVLNDKAIELEKEEEQAKEK